MTDYKLSVKSGVYPVKYKKKKIIQSLELNNILLFLISMVCQNVCQSIKYRIK